MSLTTPLYPGQVYHIYNRGINREDIFIEERNYHYFLELYSRHIAPVADTLAYCLLKNHFHLMVRIKEQIEENLTGSGAEVHRENLTGSGAEERRENLTGSKANLSGSGAAARGENLTGSGAEERRENLTGSKANLSGSGAAARGENLTGSKANLSGSDASRAFANFFNAYAKGINKTYARTGALFQRAFGRRWVYSSEYFLVLIAYIHQNPQKHGLIGDFREWPFSSYKTLVSQKPTRLVRDEVLEWFQGREQFIEFHRTDIPNGRVVQWVEEDEFR